MAPTAPASGCCGGRGRGRWTWRRTEGSNRWPSGLSVPNAGFSVDGSWADRGRGVEWSLNRLELEGGRPCRSCLVLSCLWRQVALQATTGESKSVQWLRKQFGIISGETPSTGAGSAEARDVSSPVGEAVALSSSTLNLVKWM
jgi:hypothetical protein